MGLLYKIFKRFFDIVFSAVLLVLSSPLLLIMTTLIYFSSGRPIRYKSKRLGKDKTIFTVYKFRTLVNGLKRKEHGLADNVVINRMAAFMRNTHLDEALQFVNVIRGDMSLIGPRPLDLPRYNYLKKQDPKWDYILKVRPGMTCLNQIARYTFWGLDKMKRLKGLEKLQRRNRLILDRYYVDHMSLWLDFKITVWTISYLCIGFFVKMFKKSELNL